MPLYHLIFNHHFRESEQFKELEGIFGELYDRRKDYMSILYTDCEQAEEKSTL